MSEFTVRTIRNTCIHCVGRMQRTEVLNVYVSDGDNCSSFCLTATIAQSILRLGHRLDFRGSIPGRDKRSSSSPQFPDRLEDPSSLLSNGYRWLFPPEVNRSGRMLIIAEVTNGGAKHPLPHICFNGAVLN
jgi:hypothetical protein